jgi:hypothetical protein
MVLIQKGKETHWCVDHIRTLRIELSTHVSHVAIVVTQKFGN